MLALIGVELEIEKLYREQYRQEELSGLRELIRRDSPVEMWGDPPGDQWGDPSGEL